MTSIRAWIQAIQDAQRCAPFIDKHSRECMSLHNHMVVFPYPHDAAQLLRELRGLGWYVPDESTLRDIAIGQGGDSQPHRRFKKQIATVIRLLSERPYTRRAVIQLFDFTDYDLDAEYVPLLVTAIFRMRQERLTLTVNARSMDLLLCLPITYYQATMLLELVSAELRVLPGEITFLMNSAHLFDDYQEDIAALCKRHKKIKNS